MSNQSNGRGRPATFADKAKLVEALVAIRDNTENQPSRFLVLKLVSDGMLNAVTAEKTGGRGRPAINYVLTGKTRSWVALMQRNMAKSAAKLAAMA